MNYNLFMLFGAFLLSRTALGFPADVNEERGLQVSYIDPTPHTIPLGDLALLNQTEGASGFYTPTSDFTPLELQAGHLFDLGNGTTGLEKRSGRQEFYAFRDYDCGNGAIAGVANFGCGACIAWSSCGCSGAFSAKLSMLTTGNPKPTASLFTTHTCSGAYQSIGIASRQTESCTNSQIGGIYSALVYYNC